MKIKRSSELNNKSLKLKKKYDFYDVCIQALKQTNDKIVSNSESLNRINELKHKHINRYEEQKFNKGNNSILQKIDKDNSQLFAYKKSIDLLLKEAKEKLDNQKKEKNDNINIEENTKKDRGEKVEEKEQKKFSKFFKGKQKRYTILKQIKEYLESNDFTLAEFIEKNPFQSKPYEIKGGYEFLTNVKFSDYKNVNLALGKDIHYLFVIDYFGQTAYHWAAKLGNEKMLDLLISYGRYHNQKDFKGRTPIYLAAEKGYFKTCKFLLDNGANPFLCDANSKTPADVAGNDEVRIYLKENMATPFSNPVYKAKVGKILEIRDNKIKEKNKGKIETEPLIKNTNTEEK